MKKNLNALFHQTWPMFISQLSVIGYGFIDTTMVGRFSTDDLAAMGVGVGIYITLSITLLSILFVLNPFISREYGANNYKALGEIVQQGIWLSIGLSLITFFLLTYPGILIKIANLSPAVEKKTLAYLNWIRWSVPFLFLFRVFGMFTASVSKPRIFMYLNILGLMLNVLFNYIFVFGAFGIPAMGVKGSAISTVICYIILVFLSWLLVIKSKIYNKINVFDEWSFPSPSIQKKLLKIGIPIGLIFFVDYSVFSIAALFVARLGAEHIGAYHIACNLSVLIYTIPLSLGNAASILVGQSLGEENWPNAVKTGSTSIMCGGIISFFISCFIYINRNTVVMIYTNSLPVQEIAVIIVAIVAVYHIVDSILTITSGLLRAYKKTFVPSLIYGISLWGIGLAGGYFLCFYGMPDGIVTRLLHLNIPLESKAFWITNSVSVTVAGFLVLVYYYYNTRRLKNEIHKLHSW